MKKIAKNPLVFAGMFALGFAALLLWMDRAVARQLETPAPETTELKPIHLPEISIYPLDENMRVRSLPEVQVRARKSPEKPLSCIP
ncbi:MAG: hypothetical protein JNK89_02190 [Saprospiraceae bacterium]|nr:hypothetical protein [Saprospiraceae bacterium]